MIWLSNSLTLIVPDAGYSWNASCALNLICIAVLHFSHSTVFNNEHNSYTKICVNVHVILLTDKNGLPDNIWRVDMSTDYYMKPRNNFVKIGNSFVVKLDICIRPVAELWKMKFNATVEHTPILYINVKRKMGTFKLMMP
jgi:hypothetical protein